MPRPRIPVRLAPLRHRRRPVFEAMERRDLPAVALPAFLAASGFGVSGKNSAIHANAVATDAAGNTVVTGSFRGTVAFNAATSFTSANTQDAFVAKYSPSGALTWARTFAGQATTTSGGTTTYAVGQGSAVAVDPAGNIFLAGSFSGTVNFGSAATPATIASPTCTEAFVAKLDASGNLAWARNAVGSSVGDNDPANALALDGAGGVVVAGSFANTLTIGSTRLVAAGASEAFVARYDAGGNATWAVASAGTAGSNAQALGVAVDSAGNVAVAGSYSGTMTLGAGSAAASFTSQGSNDALVWKLTASGGLLWGRSFGSTDYDSAGGVAIDAANNVYVAGTFSGTVNFGTGTQPDTLTAGPIFDAFAVKLSPAGQEAWARGYVGPNGWAKGQAVAADPSGVVHVAGAFSGSVDFDPTAGVLNLASVGSTDAFVAGLTSAGGFAYATQAGQANFNAALGVAVNAAGAVAVAGTYSGSIAFGPLAVPSAGLASAFVARLQTQATSTPSAPVMQAASTTGSTNITSVTTPTFDVVAADPVDTVTLFRDGVAVGSRVGSGPIKDPGPAAQGVRQYTTIETSLAGVASAASGATAVTILTTPPGAPTGLALLAADDSGVVGDGVTNVRAPRVVGKAAAGGTVQVLSAAGAVLGTAVASTDGTFAVQLPSLVDGTYSLQAVAIDAAANRSAKGAFALKILTTPPAAPTGLALLPADDSGTMGDGITNVKSPRVAGSAAAGATVQVLSAGGTVLGAAVAGADGTFAVQLNNLVDGTYSLQAVAVDAAANSSARGAAISLRILTTPPAAPTGLALLAADDSGTLGDGITNIRAPRFTVAAPAGTTVQLLGAANAVLGTAVAATSGLTTVAVAQGLADGTYAVRAVAVDVAGNASAAGAAFALVVDATPPAAPAAPSLLAADDSGKVGDGMTAARRPRIVGVAAPGNRVDWVAADGATVLATATAAAGTGAYTLQAAQAFPNGTRSVRIRQTDAAGNVSPLGAPFGLTVRAAPGDYFGDSRTDVAIFRPSTATFYALKPATGTLYAQNFGGTGDVPIGGDFDGDGTGEVALFRPSSALFFLLNAVTGRATAAQLGVAGDVPVPGDYDGDGKADLAVFRPSTSTFYIQMSATNTLAVRPFGGPGDIPVVGDYFGNGHADLAVYRPSTGTFYVADLLTGATLVQPFGGPGDVPLAGDYDGDGKTDFAIYRPNISTFYILSSATNALTVQPFGGAGDIPLVGDYFGAGRTSVAIFRPGSALFVAVDLTSGATLVQAFGGAGDVPTQQPLANNFALGTVAKSSLAVQVGVATPGGSAPAAASPSPRPPAATPARAVAVLAAGTRIRAGRSVSNDGGRPGPFRVL